MEVRGAARSRTACTYLSLMQSSRLVRLLGLLVLVFGVLAIPSCDRSVPPAPAQGGQFAWNSDSLWRGLEQRFVQARGSACADSSGTRRSLVRLDSLVTRLSAARVAPDAPLLDSLETNWFAISPGIAGCGALVPPYVELYARMRDVVKAQSISWDVTSVTARNRLYRALYGGRAAVEEVMLQQPGTVEPLVVGVNSGDTHSVIPSAISNGVTLHSGDILVSRGGFPTSALIARGNDYPGNFSHVALVHVDATTHAISVIEAHIEAGVAVSSADKYLADKKLRVLVLRPRADLPALQQNPMLPHLAASAMLARARREHIPYDFAMDYTNPSRLFCSEVASAAYRAQGLTLWMGISTISRDGLRQWLSSFGVEHFATQEPSDLEYDPQVQVVAEWHDPATLFNDHVDNAVTDAMLDGADGGDTLKFPWYTLPVARVLKAYSWVRVQFGGKGPVPEGMSAAAALRNKSYGAEHAARAASLRAQADVWKREKGYPPPYWTLVELAHTPIARTSR
jgi:Permuted papain-like amidase enzyme, YaeF/YiiX, C92 family